MRLLGSIVSFETKIRFMRLSGGTCALSAVAALLSLFALSVYGLNYGIDFRGGLLLEIRTSTERADLADLRSRLRQLDLGDVALQEFGAPNQVLIRIGVQPGGDAAQQAMLFAVKDALGEGVVYQRTEIVGPSVSADLITSGVLSVLCALFAVLLYLWARFEWQFAVGAVVATVHDIFLTIGVLSIAQIDFGLPVVAALLTIVGYSLNDTVVVFDRVRVNISSHKKMDLSDLLDMSVNQTMSRTLVTSGTTIIALLSLYLLGGDGLSGFSLTMILGVIIGTFSSIFVASPLLLLLNIPRVFREGVAK